MIAIGSDHGGFLLKQEIKAYLEKNRFLTKITAVMTNSPATMLLLQRRWQTQS